MQSNNNKTAEICNSLLKEFGYDQNELDRELAYVAIQEEHGFNDLVPKSIPLAPYPYESFLKMTDEDKKQFLFKNPDFFRDGEGGTYSNNKSRAMNENYSNVQWLIKIKRIFESLGDEKSMTKVENRLLMFR